MQVTLPGETTTNANTPNDVNKTRKKGLFTQSILE